MHGRPHEIDSGIDNRLLRKLVFNVYKGCREEKFSPGWKRLSEHVQTAVRGFVEKYADVTGDESADSDAAAVLLANYYEDNWNGEIEGAATPSVISEMRKQGVTRDADSDESSIRRSCGSEAC